MTPITQPALLIGEPCARSKSKRRRLAGGHGARNEAPEAHAGPPVPEFIGRLRNREAMAILENLAEGRIGEFVFPGQRPDQALSGMAMEMVFRRMRVEGVTVHGFRSTFRDWCGEATSFPREVAKAALAHVAGDATERAYRRGDALEKRRTLIEAWAAFCELGESANVVSIKRHAS